jgi:phosphate transport system substrate-binding protein
MKKKARLIVFALCVLLTRCDDYYRNDYKDNSPTSGKLRVYYDEGLRPHVENQAYTFHIFYPSADLEQVQAPEHEGILAVFNDSAESAFISRTLSEQELSLFRSRDYIPKLTPIAKSAIAFIASGGSGLYHLDVEDVKEMIAKGVVTDSSGKQSPVQVIFDGNNSSVMRYVIDSILGGGPPGNHCSTFGSSPAAIEYVSEHPRSVAVIDFAWLSDADDSLSRAYKGRIRYLGIKDNSTGLIEYPGQSGFKTMAYPFTRTIYMLRKTGDFTLAKGFESFVAGPKGQLTFLKQGLLPHRQQERSIEVKLE